MHKVQVQVREFHKVYDVPVIERPTIPNESRAELRIRLIKEELRELEEAIALKDIVGVADAIGDLLYVTYGTAIEFGIDMEPVVDEIQDSNMSKLGADGKAVHRHDGKIMKGPNYRPPDLKAVLKKQNG